MGNLRWESVGDEAPEPEERDMVSVHRANLGDRDRIDDDDDDDDDCNDDDDDYNDDDNNIDDDCDCPQFPLWLRSTSSIVLISLLQ